ncbi:MAG: DNA gyrase subunit A [Verrucomicrobiota bacterium]|nr:DNA gyrase subunit A [Verrucomicrobiota bacterium]
MQSENPRIVPVNVEDEMQRAYIDYSMSVIIGRALPDARDGLKPGNRRILYAMRQLGLLANRSYTKSAKVVGEVIGNYHPHGDGAAYDTLVRMAQNFAMRYPLVNGQGNFGSVDGDPAAAYRYTECKLQRVAEELLVDLDKDTVDMVPNFDESTVEPTVLPSRIPNLLVNGSTGIAVGMATNIPPHNLREVADGIIHLIDYPDATIDDLMTFIKGPDFPTAGIIQGVNAIRQTYHTGRGLIRVRGKAEIEEAPGNRERIVITEIPYALNKTSLIEKIADLVRNKNIDGITDIRDESDKEGMRIVIELRRDAIPNIVLSHLYKHTALESTFGAIMLAIDHGRPKTLNLKEILTCYLDHRREVILRRTRFELEKAQARAHILEGLRIALENLDLVVRIIRGAPDRETARNELTSQLELSETQANAILDMRLYQLTGLERDKVEAEFKELMDQIEYLRSILASDRMVHDLIKADLNEIKEKYGDDRRTQIEPTIDDIAIEDLIPNEACIITLTKAGYVKRVPVSNYRLQRRGGRGISGWGAKAEDQVTNTFSASTHDSLLFFTSSGKVYCKKVYEIPEAGRTARGKAIVNLLDMPADDRLAALVQIPDFNDQQHLVMATSRGFVKKTNLFEYRNVHRGGILGIKIREDDRLLQVILSSGKDELMLTTRNGFSIRFHEEDVRATARFTQGVYGIRLRNDDEVVSMAVVDEAASLLTICENGFGKRTSFAEHRIQSRGGLGIITIKTTERNGKVVSALTVQDGDQVMLTTEQGMMVRMPINDQLRVIGRATQGVRLINLRGEDHVVDASLIIGGDDEIEEVDEDPTNPTNPTEPVEPATQDSESEGTEEDSE